MSEYKEPPMLDPEDPQGCLYGIPGLHGGALYSVPMYMVEPNPNNPRKNFDQEELEKLAQSIREVGILQPLVLTKQADCAYRIVAGERRWRAAKLAGLGSVPAIILKLTPEQEAEIMLIENLQRQDLDPIEEARAYQILLEKHNYTQEALGEKLGVSQAHIANRIRLLDLPESVQENISRGIISASAAKELLSCKKADPAVIEKVAKKAVEEGMTVKQVSDAVAREMYQNSRLLAGGQWSSPKFDTEAAGCTKCKKKTMLKVPWGEGREELRCLDITCWDAKQSEFEKNEEEEREKEFLAKFPDAITVTREDDFFTQLYGQMEEYCKTKGCNNLRKARYRGCSWVMNICLNPESIDACRREADQQRKQAEEEQEAAERAEIKSLVDTKLKARSHRKTLIYIAAIILENLNPPWQADINVFQYIQEVAGDVKLEDVTEENEETWILEMLKRFSEEQLFRVIIEWPAICNWLEPDSIIEWYFKDTEGLEPDEEYEEDLEPTGRTCRVCGCTDFAACEGGCYWVEPNLCSRCAEAAAQEIVSRASYHGLFKEDPAPKISDRIEWILNNSVGDPNYDSTIPMLTDDELKYCLEHEERKSGLSKLKAEARRRAKTGSGAA